MRKDGAMPPIKITDANRHEFRPCADCGALCWCPRPPEGVLRCPPCGAAALLARQAS